jgi:hypothetical protein
MKDDFKIEASAHYLFIWLSTLFIPVINNVYERFVP